MLKFFRKSKLAGMLYIQVMAILVASAVSCVAWFSSVQTSINTDIPSSILTSYFHSGTGTELDPFVITRPVHYYNLVNLWENNYDGFDVDGGPHFQLGYKFDNTKYQFESYNDNGVLIEDTYATYLNMNYYSGNHILKPIGSGTHPFTGHIKGYGLTVQNVHVSGHGRSDIGLFGYVTAQATIENVYYDNVIIDCSTPDLNDTTDLHEGSHPYHSYIGYLAGHTVDANSWSNVYINNCRILNGEEAEFYKKNNYGYFGCVGEYEAEEPSSNINYQSTLRASDVYDYFNEANHYNAISNKGLTTRDTEYFAGDDDTFSDAVTSNGTSYSMIGDTSAGNQAKDYSLSTVGYQSTSVTYDLSYGTNHLDLDPSTTETTDSPEEQAANGEAGKYMYWDETEGQWVYYITQMTQGGSVEVEYNSYFISWDDVDISTGAILGTYYLGNVNGTITSTEFETPPTPANNPDYIWVLKDSSSSVGISSLTSSGGTETIRFYSPEYETYLCCDEGGSASSPEDPYMVSTYNAATAFTIDGPNSNIQFGGGTYSFINNGGIGGGVPNSNYRAVPFHFSGGVTTTEEDPSAKTYDLVTDIDDFVAGEIYAFAYGTNGSIKAMSATQMTNNRVAIVASASNGVLSYTSDLGEFELVGDSDGWSFKDIKNSTESTSNYLCTPTSSSNRMTLSSSLNDNTKYTLSLDSNYQYKVTNVAYTSRFIAYNTREGTNGFLFSSYTVSSGETEHIHFYKLDEESTGWLTTAGAFQYEATTGAVEDQLVSYAYDVYRNLPNELDYEIFNISRAEVSLMEFDFPNSQVTITWPEPTDGGWELVTDHTTLSAGDEIVIAAIDYDYAISETQNSNNRGQASITKVSEPPSITFSDNAGVCSFVLGGTTGAWTFYDEVNEGYLYAASSSNNYLRTQATNNANGEWTISISSGVATVVSNGSYTRNTMRYNHTSSLFSCYASGQDSISLYRFVEAEEHDGVPIYIGDNIDEDYDPQYIDVVGGTTFSSTSFNISNYYSSIYSPSYYGAQNEDQGIGTEFFNTLYASSAIVVTVKRTGLLDLGTLVLSYTGNATPMLTKGKSSSGGSASGVEIGPNGFKCPDLDPDLNEFQYSMSFSPHNILKNAYCTLDVDGNIYSTHDVTGAVVACVDQTFDNSKIDSYILMITNASATEMNVTEVDFTFKTIPGNTGDFGSVGYRSAVYVDGANSNSPSTQIIGTILNLYYVIDDQDDQQTYCKVVYNMLEQTYYVTFKSTTDCEINVFNYDTSTYDLYVNGVQYYGGSNVVQITAESYNSETWV
jgi:hypothetical protein